MKRKRNTESVLDCDCPCKECVRVCLTAFVSFCKIRVSTRHVNFKTSKSFLSWNQIKKTNYLEGVEKTTTTTTRVTFHESASERLFASRFASSFASGSSKIVARSLEVGLMNKGFSKLPLSGPKMDGYREKKSLGMNKAGSTLWHYPSVSVCVRVCACATVNVCVWESERVREREKESEREIVEQTQLSKGDFLDSALKDNKSSALSVKTSKMFIAKSTRQPSYTS